MTDNDGAVWTCDRSQGHTGIHINDYTHQWWPATQIEGSQDEILWWNRWCNAPDSMFRYRPTTHECSVCGKTHRG